LGWGRSVGGPFISLPEFCWPLASVGLSWHGVWTGIGGIMGYAGPFGWAVGGRLDTRNRRACARLSYVFLRGDVIEFIGSFFFLHRLVARDGSRWALLHGRC